MKYIDIEEFRNVGYMHELNRLFLHPLGLALEVQIDDDGNQYISGIQDHREDPEGVYYESDTLDLEKVINIEDIIQERYTPRLEALGFWTQPVE